MAADFQHVVTRDHHGTLVIEVVDPELNAFEQVHRLRDEIVQAMTDAETANAVLDLNKVKYMTSVALLPFVDVRKTAQRNGGQVVLCNVSDVVAKVLTVSQLLVETRGHAKHLAIATDLDAAVELLKS